MKQIILIITFFFSLNSIAKEKVTLQFTNGPVDFYANVNDSINDDGFYFEDVSIEIPGVSHGSLHLVAEFGWGDQPYNFMCEQLSSIFYSNDVYRYASAYGYATTFGLFSGVFSEVEFFIVNRDGSYEISDSYPNAVYDSGFACTEKEFIY
jgi:hypothetical protein